MPKLRLEAKNVIIIIGITNDCVPIEMYLTIKFN